MCTECGSSQLVSVDWKDGSMWLLKDVRAAESERIFSRKENQCITDMLGIATWYIYLCFILCCELS